MAGETRPYVVRAGDYLTAIAYANGIKPADLWKDPSNARLRKLRGNPEMLAPGDLLYVPVVRRKWLPVSVGATNQFVANPPKVQVHVILKAADGKPFAGKKIRLDPKVTDEAYNGRRRASKGSRPGDSEDAMRHRRGQPSVFPNTRGKSRPA